MRTIACPAVSAERVELAQEVPSLYQVAEPLPFRQTWLGNNTMPVEGGEVRICYDEKALRIFAQMEDSDIFTDATENNQLLCSLGDVFEFFVQPNRPERDYYEFHVAPNNLIMDIHISCPARWRSKEISYEDALVYESGCSRQTRVFAESNLWVVELCIPWKGLDVEAPPAAGTVWRFAAARYNYFSNGRETEHSCTASLSEFNYHQIEKYSSMSFSLAAD